MVLKKAFDFLKIIIIIDFRAVADVSSRRRLWQRSSLFSYDCKDCYKGQETMVYLILIHSKIKWAAREWSCSFKVRLNPYCPQRIAEVVEGFYSFTTLIITGTRLSRHSSIKARTWIISFLYHRILIWNKDTSLFVRHDDCF